jgi:hypothetical protein
MGRVAQTPLAAVGLLTPAPGSAATTAHRHVRKAAGSAVSLTAITTCQAGCARSSCGPATPWLFLNHVTPTTVSG